MRDVLPAQAKFTRGRHSLFPRILIHTGLDGFKLHYHTQLQYSEGLGLYNLRSTTACFSGKLCFYRKIENRYPSNSLLSANTNCESFPHAVEFKQSKITVELRNTTYP